MLPFDPDLARPLDKIIRADLESSSSFWFWFLVISTIVVAAGIFFEAPEVWQAVGLGRNTIERIRKFWYVRIRKVDLNGWERVCPELLTKNDRHRKWVAKAGLIGWLLVAIGVGGEGVAEYFVNDAETSIRAFDEADLSQTQRFANSASAAASLANTFSNKAEKSSSNALTLATGARQEADSFEQDIKSAKGQAAEAESRLADALQHTARLEQQLSWRAVSPEQKAELSKLLLSSSRLLMPLSNLKIDVAYLNQIPEAEEYASELKDALV